MPSIKTTVSSHVSYEKIGAGPVLVLLHGFPESHTLWRNISKQLAASYTVIMPDFPGSGDSLLEQDTTISEMAACVIAILDNEHIDKAVVAGHSMGGYVAFALAAEHPDRLAGISLVHSTPLADDDEKKKTRLKAIELIQKGGKSAFVRQMVANLFSPDFRQTNMDAVEQQIELALQLPEASLVNYYRAMIGRPDRSAILTGLPFPVQWIAGEDDSVIYYKKILEHCTKSGINFVSVYSRCGHMSMLEMPATLINDLRGFVDYCY